MIEVKNVEKSFGDVKAVDHISLDVQDHFVFGMLGTNGAGKSTLLRMMAGVLKADQGNVLLDGEAVYDNPKAKGQIFYISDEQFFFPNATIEDMEHFYEIYYPDFDKEKFQRFIESFDLPVGRKINGFSKGMKKQLSLLLGICSNARYLLCDETFDGLDPVVRQSIKSIFAAEMDEREFTPIIASHNLRELEDICDHVGLLHKGGILLSKDLEEMKCQLHRIQFVAQGCSSEEINRIFDVVQYKTSGKLVTLTVRGEEEEIMETLASLKPIYYEMLPLSLEEIFISETEVVGYDVKNLIF
ncbi:MAG: ABC transporter ATP-binding protein [Eubacteriales bacterium]|nr:ABC transporter ATP-binding protein [Eubacteriales bacterium]